MQLRRLYAAALAAALLVPVDCLARGEWPERPYTEWFKNLQRPDNDRHPGRWGNSRYCCGAADVVKTKFKVESAGGPHPEDQWYAWLNETWERIPPEKINPEYAPDGQAYLFLLGNSIQCFVRPKGGL